MSANQGIGFGNQIEAIRIPVCSLHRHEPDRAIGIKHRLDDLRQSARRLAADRLAGDERSGRVDQQAGFSREHAPPFSRVPQQGHDVHVASLGGLVENADGIGERFGLSAKPRSKQTAPLRDQRMPCGVVRA